MDLRTGQVLVHEGQALAFAQDGPTAPAPEYWSKPPAHLHHVPFSGSVLRFERPWHLFQHCGAAIVQDHKLLSEGRRSAPISAYNTVIGDPDRLFIEEGAVVEASVLNTTNGPIYIGNGAEVMEGCLIRGPFSLGDQAQLKMGTRIYGPTTIGPGCRVGGEVSNSVITGFSNKAHDGFLGNSVLGEWCNLGADTNTSNLKNTYGTVQVWDHMAKRYTETGLQFCGMLMGDHAKSGINTMFNTGTVVGVAANVFGAGFPPKHGPSFSWGGAEGLTVHELDKALSTARMVMQRRGMVLNTLEEQVLRHVFLNTETG
jgi:UDP-N-acetylglucosamine diphosphorylase/glucosamine-1-phosphate N-acetyltransferase